MNITLEQMAVILNHHGIALTLNDLHAAQSDGFHRYVYSPATQFPQNSLLLDTLRYIRACATKKIAVGNRQVGFMIQPACNHDLVVMVLYCHQVNRDVLSAINSKLQPLLDKPASQVPTENIHEDKIEHQALQDFEIRQLLQKLYASIECVLLGLNHQLDLDKEIIQQLAYLIQIAYIKVSVNFVPLPVLTSNDIFLEDILRVFLKNTFSPERIQSEIVTQRNLSEYQPAELKRKFQAILISRRSEHQSCPPHPQSPPQPEQPFAQRLQGSPLSADFYKILLRAYKYQQLLNAFEQLRENSTNLSAYQTFKVRVYQIKNLSIDNLVSGLPQKIKSQTTTIVFNTSTAAALNRLNEQLLERIRDYEKTKVYGFVPSAGSLIVRCRDLIRALPLQLYQASLVPLTIMAVPVLVNFLHASLLHFSVYQRSTAYLLSSLQWITGSIAFAVAFMLTASSYLSTYFSQLPNQITAENSLHLFSILLGLFLTYCLGIYNFLWTTMFMICHDYAYQVGYQPRFDDTKALVASARLQLLNPQYLSRLIGFGFAFVELMITGSRTQMLVYLGALMSSVMAVQCIHPQIPQNNKEAMIVLSTSLIGQKIGYYVMFFLLSIYQGIQYKLLQQDIFLKRVTQLAKHNEIDQVNLTFSSPYNPLGFFSSSNTLKLTYRNRTSDAWHTVNCQLSDNATHCEGQISDVVSKEFRVN